MNETLNQTINQTINKTIEVVTSPPGQNGLDKFMNIAIPIILLIGAGAFIYSKFGEQLKTFFEWLKGVFGNSQDKFSNMRNSIPTKKDLVYT